MDRSLRQDSNATSTPAGKSRPSAQVCHKTLRTRVAQLDRARDHSSYSEGDHCPLRLSGLPAAHTFFWVIPQRPAPHFTVHSVGGLQPTPSSEWFLKARTFFHISLSEMQLVQDSVQKIFYTLGFSQNNLACGLICFINFACGAIFPSIFLRQFVSDSQFACRK